MIRTLFLLVALQATSATYLMSADSTTATPVADAFDERHYVLSAYPSNILKLRVSIGVSLTVLPQPLTEYPTPAPGVDIRGKLSLPLGLNGQFRIASNIATSIAQGGGFWSTNLGMLSVGAGYSVAFVYGNITFVDGFRTTQYRWINYPMLTASWSFPKAALTARLEGEFTTSVESTIESQPTKSNRNLLTGGALTVAIEQPFFKSTHVVIGATFQYSSDPYQAWFLYNQFRDRLFSSEFFVGFIL